MTIRYLITCSTGHCDYSGGTKGAEQLNYMSCLSNHKLPSQLIRDAIGNKDHAVKVEDLVNAYGSQSFGLLFIIMALPLTIPLPPGIGFIPAALLCIWSVQRSFGGTNLWLPKAIGKWELSEKFINKIEIKALPLCERLEKRFLSRRKTKMLNEVEIRLASLIVAFQSILIMLPTPFLNTIPAVITILTGLTILNNNRKLLWINISFGLLALFFIGSTLYVGAQTLFEEIIDHI